MGSYGHGGEGWAAYSGGRPRGPYGSNLGDIWSGEDSPVGKMLMERNGVILIHEVLEKDGKIQELVYNVDKDTSDPELQDLIQRARKGLPKWVAAQAASN